MVLKKDAVCLTDDMILAKNNSQKAITSIVPDYYTFDEPYEPYNFAAHLKPGVKYGLVVDGTMDFRADQFREAQWDPATGDFGRFGMQYLKKCGMYNYAQVSKTTTEAHYKYKVKMKSMIGPDHADQEQFHHVLINTPRRIVIKVTAKTQNFPYSDAFNIEQIWMMENIDDKTMRLIVKTGIDWIDKPNAIIKKFIVKDIADSRVKMAKYLRSIYALTSTKTPSVY